MVYVPLLAHVDGKDELPEVNMIKVCMMCTDIILCDVYDNKQKPRG